MKRIFLFGLAILVTGCASTHDVKKPIERTTWYSQAKYSIKDIEDKSEETVPEYFLHAIKDYLKAELKDRGMVAEENLTPDREIAIQVIYYRMRSGFARTLFGVMAGKDGVKSTVTVLETKTGEVMGSCEVDTFNVTAFGQELDIARMHAEEIVHFLEGKSE